MGQKGLSRLPDWRARFAAEMNRQRLEPFSWGTQDCALGLACGAVQAITGEDLAVGFRSKYRGPVAAKRVLREAGFETLGDLVASMLPEIPPAFAETGDLGLIESDGPFGEALSVVDVSGLIVMDENGHGMVPRSRMIRAFKVG